MDTLQGIVMGFVQGLTEFLPVSSSAHLVFASGIYKMATGAEFLGTVASTEEIFFDVVVHLATLFAVFIAFKDDIANILKGLFGGFFGTNKAEARESEGFKMGVYVLLGTFVTAVMIFLFKDLAIGLVNNPSIVALLLLGTGFMLFFSERYSERLPEGKKDAPLTLKTALIIAAAQGLAAFPGFSRSGFTIAAGLFCGMDRVKAARYSFLLSIPIILSGNVFFALFKLDIAEIQTFNIKALVAGFIVAFISGYLFIKFLMWFLSRSSLKSFAYYCWAVGLVMLLLFQVAHHQ
jgi:undecaprenyl-diphosphatase